MPLTAPRASVSFRTVFAIKLLRTMLRIGQSQLAERAGISVRELARIENAEVLPRPPAAKALDKAFAEFVLERATEAVEDAADVKVARKRLREIAKHPERVISLADLKRELKETT